MVTPSYEWLVSEPQAIFCGMSLGFPLVYRLTYTYVISRTGHDGRATLRRTQTLTACCECRQWVRGSHGIPTENIPYTRIHMSTREYTSEPHSMREH